MAKDEDDKPPSCPDCGDDMRFVKVPTVDLSDFERARVVASLVWKITTVADGSRMIGVVCLTAALLLKRAAVSLAIPHQAVHMLSNLYVNTAHEIISDRRAQASKEAN